MSDPKKVPTIEELMADMKRKGYQPPTINQLNPELRTVKYTAATVYGLSAFSVDNAVGVDSDAEELD